jgi:hypothetical protein
MVNANSLRLSSLSRGREQKKVDESCRHDSYIQHVFDNNSDFSPLLIRLFRPNREEKKFSHVAIALLARQMSEASDMLTFIRFRAALISPVRLFS